MKRPSSLLFVYAATAVACGGASSSAPTAASAGSTPQRSTRVADTVQAQPGPPVFPVEPSAAAPEPPPQPSSGPTVTVPAARGHIRIIHAAADPALADAVIFVDRDANPFVPRMAFGTAAGYVVLPVGPHVLMVRPRTAPTNSPPLLRAELPAIEADQMFTTVLHGGVAGAPLASTSSPDRIAPAPPGRARVRLFHAAPALGTVDLCAPGPRGRAAPLITAVAYGAWGTAPDGGYAELPAGAPSRVQIRAQNARPCTGAVLGAASLHPVDAAAQTLVLAATGSGAERRLLLCNDPSLPTAAPCTSEPLAPR